MRKILFLFVVSLFSIHLSRGQQILGGDITWECINSGSQQGKYIFTLNLYNRCSAGAAPTSNQTINVQGANLNSFPVIYSSEIDINPPCYDSTLEISCPNNSTDALSKASYVSQPVSLNGLPPSTGWVFTYKTCCRANSMNIQGNPGMTLKSVFYSDTVGGSSVCIDNSPKFLDHPTPQICLGYTQSLTNRAYDPDHDNVVHTWANPLDSSGNAIQWKTGCNVNNQLPGTYFSSMNVPATLVPYNGEIKFHAYAPSGYFFYTIKVASYRGSVLVSEIYKESFVSLRSCPPTPTIPPLANTPPSVVFKNVGAIPTTRPLPLVDTIYAGDSVKLEIISTDIQFLPYFVPQRNFLIARSDQFGNQFSDRWNGCNDPPCATMDTSQFYDPTTQQWQNQYGVTTVFTWLTDSSQGSPEGDAYQFHFYVRDDWCPTPGIVEHTYTVVVLRPDNYLTGTVYKDLNNNGTRDGNEQGVPNILVKQSPNFYFSSTAYDGSFYIGAQNGQNNLEIVPLPYHNITQPSGGMYTISTTGYGNTYSGNDFGIFPLPGVNDLVISMTPTGLTRPGWSRFIFLNYKNIGTTTLSGSVTLEFDTSNTVFKQSYPSKSSGSGGSYLWTFSNLKPQQTKQIRVLVKTDTSVNFGDSIWLFARVNPLVGDTTPLDNKDSVLTLASNSYDPNSKKVIPARDFYLQEVKSSRILEYTIHFQNTGTDTAHTVRIEDHLFPSLNIEHFEMLGASHDYSYTVRGREVVWLFENIGLPDSATNEAESHGYLTFRIVADTALQLGDSVYNQVGIFFDINDPVLTDVTSFIVEAPVDTTDTVGTFMDSRALDHWLELFPNPTSGEVTVRIKTLKNSWMKVQVYDLQGHVRAQANLFTSGESLQRKFDLNGLPKGLYLVKLSSHGISVTKKLVVQ